jgi:GntR family transcriptional regulator, transcriptional repressor for pyruvate dehydrogenase complex
MTTPTGEVKRIADSLLERILRRKYPAGLRLPPEATLADEFHCGRSTVREALRYLAGLGLVQSRRGSGIMVLDFEREGMPALLPTYLRLGGFENASSNLMGEMLQLRTLMASQAVRLAADYAGPDKLARAREHLLRAPELQDDPAAHAINELAMYRELVVASGMWPAVWMVNSFWAPLSELNAMFAPVLGEVHPAFQSTMHELFAYIEQGQAEPAVKQINDWFTMVDAPLLAKLEQLQQG